MPATPRSKKKGAAEKKGASSPVPEAPAFMVAEDDDVAESLLAEALGKQRIGAAATPAPAAAKATGMLSARSGEEENFPLTARAGGHDLTADNWATRSKQMAQVARQNEVRSGARCARAHGRPEHGRTLSLARARVRARASPQAAELEAKLRLGMLTKREQAKLGPSLLAEAEAAAVAQQQQMPAGGTAT